MTLKEFWEHIEKSRRRDADEHEERLVARLAKRPVNDILDFAHIWDEMLYRTYTWNLWGAAYLINGGCSDDGFRDFRVWLVGRGRHAYEHALKNPDSLADILDGDPVDGFGLDTAALRAYEARTGASDFYELLARRTGAPPSCGKKPGRGSKNMFIT